MLIGVGVASLYKNIKEKTLKFKVKTILVYAFESVILISPVCDIHVWACSSTSARWSSLQLHSS